MDFLKIAVPFSVFGLEICSVHKNGVEVQTKLIGAMFSILVRMLIENLKTT